MMAEPKRVQLSRAKGWRMPNNTVTVARPSLWGNPFRVGVYCDDRALCVKAYRRCVGTWPVRKELIKLWQSADGHLAALRLIASRDERFYAALAGKNLACWCKLGEPCHADVLLELANA